MQWRKWCLGFRGTKYLENEDYFVGLFRWESVTRRARSRSFSSQYQHDTSGKPVRNPTCVLMLTHGISVVVIGTERRTLITLVLDHLYNRRLRLQQSVGNNNWILQAGVLHITFAALHDLDKQLMEVASTYVSLNAEHIHMQYF